jgi:hypothetical protein
VGRIRRRKKNAVKTTNTFSLAGLIVKLLLSFHRHGSFLNCREQNSEQQDGKLMNIWTLYEVCWCSVYSLYYRTFDSLVFYSGHYLSNLYSSNVTFPISYYRYSSPATRHEGALGEKRNSSYSFTTSALDEGEWSASRPGRALPPGKGPPVPIVQEAGWAPEPVWTQEARGKILSPLPGIEPRSPGRPARSQTLYCLSYPAPYLLLLYI